MTDRILILGGYGNFGKRLAYALTRDGFKVIIAGRNREKASLLVNDLPAGSASDAIFDVRHELPTMLEILRPKLLINTCGPFQNSSYEIARHCIRHRVHYIDLADGRDFVTGITQLDQEAKEQGVAVISGASTVPGLSSAVIEHYMAEFSTIESLRFGISPGQKAERGLATTQGIFSYVGKPLRPSGDGRTTAYGWQDIHSINYPELGRRWMANCDIPDLDLLPARYGIKSIRFSAGLQLGLLHFGLWGISWLVRLGFPIPLQRMAKPLLAISNLFDRFGSADGGMHIIINGQNPLGQSCERRWFIVARQSHGPQIPTIPALVLAKRCIRDQDLVYGAQACVGLVSLDDILTELKPFDITTYSWSIPAQSIETTIFNTG